MSSKFVKKLKKDLKKSPGKAAVLAALLAVAVWFWSPLVMGMFGGSSTPRPIATGTATNASGATTTASATPPTTAPQYNWKQIATAIDRDPKMSSARHVASTRDPFRAVEPKKPKHETETKPVEPPPVVLDVPPAAAGIVLQSTIVGRTRGVARVNGKSYRRGDSIRGSFGNKNLDYILVAIGGRSVVLALGEQEYELKMLRSQVGSAATGTVGVSSESPEFDPTVLE